MSLDNGWSGLVPDFGTSEKFHFAQSQMDFPESSNCQTTWEIQWSAFSQMIYDVDSLWDFGASRIFPLSRQKLKTTEVTKSEGLECLTTMLLFPDLMVVKGLPSPEQIQ
jgi:hypothetical protein